MTRAPETNCRGGGGTCPPQLPVTASPHPERYRSPGHSPLMQISIFASGSWAVRPQRSPLAAGLGELPFRSVSTQTSSSGGLCDGTVSTRTQPPPGLSLHPDSASTWTQPFLFPDPLNTALWDTHPMIAIALRYPPTENTLVPAPAPLPGCFLALGVAFPLSQAFPSEFCFFLFLPQNEPSSPLLPEELVL